MDMPLRSLAPAKIYRCLWKSGVVCPPLGWVEPWLPGGSWQLQERSGPGGFSEVQRAGQGNPIIGNIWKYLEFVCIICYCSYMFSMKSSRINRVDSTLDFHWAFLWGEALGPAIFSLDIWIREGAIFSTSCHLGRGADFGMSFHHELSATQQLRTSEHWAGGSIENIQHWAGGSSENIWGDLNNWAGAQNKLRQSGVWKLKISSATWPGGGVLEA